MEAVQIRPLPTAIPSTVSSGMASSIASGIASGMAPMATPTASPSTVSPSGITPKAIAPSPASSKTVAINSYYLINSQHPHLSPKDIEYNNAFVRALNVVNLRIQDFRDGVITNNSEIQIVCNGHHRWYGRAGELLTPNDDKFVCGEMLIRGCPICPWLKQIYTTGGIIPVEDIPRKFGTRSIVANCQLDHRFLVEDVRHMPDTDKLKCPVCVLEHKTRCMKKRNIVFLNSVYTDSACQLRFRCLKPTCGAESYVAVDCIMGNDYGAFDCVERMHAPEKRPEFVRMRRLFETEFKRRFDDYDALLFAQVYPCGYNAQLGIVYFHEAHNRGASVSALVTRLLDMKFKVVVFPRDCIESAEIVRHFLQTAIKWGMYQEEHLLRELQRIRTEEREQAKKTSRLFNLALT